MLEFVAGRLQCHWCITLQIESDRVRKLPWIYSATILFLENFKLNSEHSSAGLTYIFLRASWPVCQLFNIYVPFPSGKILTRLHSSNLVWPGVDRLLCGLVLVTRTTRRVTMTKICQAAKIWLPATQKLGRPKQNYKWRKCQFGTL
jgi:hypothetical protein